jgi:hypothetical protein
MRRDVTRHCEERRISERWVRRDGSDEAISPVREQGIASLGACRSGAPLIGPLAMTVILHNPGGRG